MKIYVSAIFACMGLLVLHTAYGATISGYVKSQMTGEPVSDMDIDIYDQNWNSLNYYPVSDQDGFYQITELPPGVYYIKADPHFPQRYRQEYWRNSYTMSGASQILLNAGQTVSNIDFLLDPASYIGGVIRSTASGAVVPDISVQVYDALWQEVDETGTSNTQGAYYVGGLPAGRYFIKANAIYPAPYIDQYWNHAKGPNSAVSVELTLDADLLTINFDLDTGGYIIGEITDQESNLSIDGILVVGYNSKWEKMRIQDHTNSQGEYILGAWESGLYYIKAETSYPDPYLPEYYDGTHIQDEAVPVTVQAPNNTTGIDIRLNPAAYIVGTVTLEGTPQTVSGIDVLLFDNQWHQQEMQATTDSQGIYYLGPLASGDYYVAAPPDTQYFYREYYQDAPVPEQATLIGLTAPTSEFGINFTLTSKGATAFGVDLEMPAALFYPNDICYLDARVINYYQSLTNVPLFVVLSVLDMYYFFPSWTLYNPPESMAIDYQRMNVGFGQMTVSIIPPFAWPVTDTELMGIGFYGAFLTNDFTAVIGNLDYIEFGYAR